MPYCLVAKGEQFLLVLHDSNKYPLRVAIFGRAECTSTIST